RSGARGARAAGRDERGDRYAGGEDGLDDVAHGRVETARRVHLEHDELDLLALRTLEAAHDEIRSGGADGAVHGNHVDDRRGPTVRCNEPRTERKDERREARSELHAMCLPKRL